MSIIHVTAPYSRVHDSRPNRAKLLHLLLLSTVTFQMITGLMGWLFGWFPFEWHIIVGQVLIVVLLLQWGWLMLSRSGRITLRYLFPLNPVGLRVIVQDIRGLSQGILAPPGPRAGLPGLMHGVFLLTVTLVATAGLTLLGGFRGWWSGIPFGWLLDILRWGAVAIALQWIGHVGMVFLHVLAGDPLWNMFKLRLAHKGCAPKNK
ncbi:hypothetical protein H7F10_15320 [Acidithiobacillus sp. HP-6]|uniref:cytochrome b/b6 domain-containing protein n=1 Tax=unclassified Acidithiobacillus TaxID=2614800 RepID=UPI00187A5D1D|nr:MULTISPECIES: cytochrome b/b6 domain-containing protein [unclassified Acidithiobacillus]MBE7564267.1 hypothetical protein [Acidithiobacillus sp. HP-6]MBE7570181.1 hypothetical protein [Acidithiobacillus sp. HP-2]